MIQIRGRSVLAAASIAATLAVSSLAFGASSGSAHLYTPQGSGTAAASGDYLTTNNPPGLNTFYRYFVEVPSGLSRLRIQIYDADFGEGGSATETAAGRDRGRANGGANFTPSTVRYTLIDPSGKQRPTNFAIGTTTTPPGADAAWLSLFDGTGTGTGNFVADNFLTAVYTRNDGNNNWTGNWTETGDDNSATGGKIQAVVSTAFAAPNTNVLRIGGTNGTPSIFREANLSGTLGLTTANLTFNFRSVNSVAGDSVIVEASGNGGTTYTTLTTLTNATAAGAKSFSLAGLISTNTRIRFRVTGGLTGTTDFFYIDTVQIADGGGALTAGHWEVRVDESSAVTTGDDINAFGIRADDGDATSGGTEIPIYIDSMNEFGVNPPASGQNSNAYDAYPYITSGCTAKEQDFDYDSNQPDTVGSIVFTSRTGATTQTVPDASLSMNNVWAQNTINSWTTDSDATDYGIWSMNLTINSYNDATTGLNGNYTTFYVGNSSSAVPPPTANPQANGFRIYLPTDAGAAPVKPYVEQFVRYFSGPNPPVVGTAQRDTVTVRVVNPTASAITFSTTNLVTVNVPGTTVLYAGNPQKTQGTIVSAPAIGGSGNITWNPGTVSAGSTVILSYNVDIKPTAAGQRNTAVGTVASGNGTKAVYVDETGNTTQSRATYTFGPICEVAVTQGTLTEAVVAGLDAYAADNGVAVEWRTASEAGTIGFDLYRRAAPGSNPAWVKVNRDLLLGLLTAPQGGTYRFVDEGAAPRERQTYLLVEVEASGRRRSHGPFTVTPDWSRRPEVGGAYARAAHAPLPATREARALTVPTVPTSSGPADALHVLVRESGLYYLSSADLAPRFGLPLANLQKMIADGKLLLTRGGQPVAWYPDSDGKLAKGLYFYGEAIASLLSQDNVYRLERGFGSVMKTVAAGASSGSAPTVFVSSAHAEQDVLPATAVALDPQKDYWFWDFVSGGDPTYGSRTFPMDAPGATTGAAASLTVHLQGASSSGVAGEHHPTMAVNGTALGDGHFQGITSADFTFALDPAILKASGNQIQVGGLLDAGVPYSIFYVNSFDLSYPRTFRATGGALAFPGTAGGAVAAGGFADPAVRLVDVTDPANPRWVTGAAVGADGQGGYSLAFRSPSAGRYLAAATAGLKAPTAITPFRVPRLRSTSNHADLIVVAGPGLHDAAQRLADYRTSQGLDSMVVDWDEVIDEFAAGFPDPQAIPSFLAYARSSWRTAPRYLVLAGAGTVDYRNLLGYGGELVPPLFVASDGGLFPADALLADLTGGAGDTGLPELAVGRIPAHSAAELSAYVDKVIAYETGTGGAWVGSALALADATDQAADFAAGSDQLATLFPVGYGVDRIYLDAMPLADARSRLLHDLQAGASLVDYMGHGGLDRMSAGGLLANSDVAALANGPRVPVLTAMTCSINRFAVPGVPSLGELLVDQSGAGAAAVWAPSGLSLHNEAQLLAERYYRHLSDPDNPRLGDVVLRALQEFQHLGGSKSMIQIYNLLGDPALRLRRPNPATGVPGPGSPIPE